MYPCRLSKIVQAPSQRLFRVCPFGVLSALHVSVNQLFLFFHSLLVLALILSLYGLRQPTALLLGPKTTYKTSSYGEECHNTPTSYKTSSRRGATIPCTQLCNSLSSIPSCQKKGARLMNLNPSAFKAPRLPEVSIIVSSAYGICTSKSPRSSGASRSIHGMKTWASSLVTCSTCGRLYTISAVRCYLLVLPSQQLWPFPQRYPFGAHSSSQ